ncbi:DUF1573 domain-containing protein [Planctomycetales bacterium ZRK34]|nr:DUF1573 domain-containing protein [Planctomycetales bacterium ZRK34]
MGVVSKPAWGQLRWGRREVRIEARPVDESASAVFEFVNEGKTPITISRVTTSCGCITTKLDQQRYEPGEHGRIEASFEFGRYTGAQLKTIRVFSDDPVQPEMHLTMRVMVPKVLEIEPFSVFWRREESPAPKTIHITTVIGDPVDITSVDAGDGPFEVELKKLEPGRVYELIVTPRQTGIMTRARFTLHTNYPASSPRQFTAYASTLGARTTRN